MGLGHEEEVGKVMIRDLRLPNAVAVLRAVPISEGIDCQGVEGTQSTLRCVQECDRLGERPGIVTSTERGEPC